MSDIDRSGGHVEPARDLAWESMGFSNAGGDRVVNGVPVITNFKGPGKDRAVYQLSI